MNSVFKDITDFPSTRFAECLLGKQTEFKMLDLSQEVFDRPLAKKRSIENVKLEYSNFPYNEKGELLPNITYEAEKYRYQTDREGRLIKAEGTLRLEDGVRNENAQRRAGGEDRLPGDQGGHLIGRQFGGSGGLENLVAMKGELNQGEYKKLEMDFRKALGDGHNVELKVVPRYQGDSQRPSSFVVTYSIDGERTKKVFDNT